jgi:hypothetical protein
MSRSRPRRQLYSDVMIDDDGDDDADDDDDNDRGDSQPPDNTKLCSMTVNGHGIDTAEGRELLRMSMPPPPPPPDQRSSPVGGTPPSELSAVSSDDDKLDDDDDDGPSMAAAAPIRGKDVPFLFTGPQAPICRYVDASNLTPKEAARRMLAIDNFFAEPGTVTPFHGDDCSFIYVMWSLVADVREGRGDVLRKGDDRMNTTTWPERKHIYELTKLYMSFE